MQVRTAAALPPGGAFALVHVMLYNQRGCRISDCQRISSESAQNSKQQAQAAIPLNRLFLIRCFRPQVTAVAVDASGQWLASSSRDGSVRAWEVATGRCVHTWQLGAPALAVAWCPDATVRIVSAVTRDKAVLLPLGEALPH